MYGVNPRSIAAPNENKVNMLKKRCPKSACTKPHVSRRSYWCSRRIAGGHSTKRSIRREFLNAANEIRHVIAMIARFTGASASIATPVGSDARHDKAQRYATTSACAVLRAEQHVGPLVMPAEIDDCVRAFRHDAPAARASVHERSLHQCSRDAAAADRFGHARVRDRHRRAGKLVI